MAERKRAGSRFGPTPKEPERVRSRRLALSITPPEDDKLRKLARARGVTPAALAYEIFSKGLGRLPS